MVHFVLLFKNNRFPDRNGGLFLMMAQLINRRQVKLASRRLLQEASVSAMGMVTLLFLLTLALNLLGALGDTLTNPILGTFLNILSYFMNLVLSAGFVLYCMAIRRGEHAEYLSLFDGFSMVGKVVGLYLLEALFIALWSMLFLFPGIIAAYRYRFAMYNILENPDLGIFQALELSKRQTMGYKMQCFLLDFSYFGWVFLATVPAYLLSLSYTMTSFYTELDPFFQTLSSLHPLAATLITGVWSLLIGYFYYANQTCSDLEYYETAKTTSGLTPFSDPSPNPPENFF